jgi:hypothetical protein
MLLSVNSINTAKYGTVLDLWYVGGQHAIAKRPFDPYLFSIQIQRILISYMML